jgi:hypothetical protein
MWRNLLPPSSEYTLLKQKGDSHAGNFKAANSSETLITTYKTARHQKPEDHNLNGHYFWKLKSHDLTTYYVAFLYRYARNCASSAHY